MTIILPEARLAAINGQGAAGPSEAGTAFGVGVARKVNIGFGGVASGDGAPTSIGAEVANNWFRPSATVKRRTS